MQPTFLSPQCRVRARLLLSVPCFVLSTAGCRSPSAEPTPAASSAAPTASERAATPSGSATPPATYGAQLAGEPDAKLADVLATPERFLGTPVTIDGHVRRACTRRGCWMELADGDDDTGPRCRVTFKDYGFFVPTDSAGSTARVEGQVQLQRVSPSRVAHLESEGATFANKQADGSATEVTLVATGVELRR